MKDDDILLTTHDLMVGYHRGKQQLPILKHLNISIYKGELVCLMGQNGVGKSTLIRTLSGVQLPLSGEVRLGHDDIHALSGPDRAKAISLVLTERLNAGNLLVREVIQMGRYPYVGLNINLSESDHQRIREAVAMTDVGSLLDRPIHQLSDGQLQKVMITRALCQDGDVIILDEPTVHLDLNNRVAMIRLLKSLTTITDKAIVMATHELDLALQAADRLLLINQDGEVKEGLPEDLVLSGILDEVFDLKGYNLKTGKYLHEYGDRGNIRLTGEGYSYLWTKNALERVGYHIVDDKTGIIGHIVICDSADQLQWKCHNNKGKEVIVDSIRHLMDYLKGGFDRT